MVNWSWLINLFYKKSSEFYDPYKFELDKNKEGIENLMALTLRLDEMEEDIRNHNNFLNAVANSSVSPMWVKDEKGHYLFVNESCAKTILKSTVEEVLHLTDTDLKDDVLAPICMQSDELVRKSLKTRRFIEHARYKDGRDVWLDTTKSPLMVNGKLNGVVGTAKDIVDLVPKDIKDHCIQPGLIEIDLNLDYYIGKEVGKRKNDLITLLKKYKEEC